jgi:hydroxymethylpyrimidine pyrophosphatase-like HAD family hydrolase
MRLAVKTIHNSRAFDWSSSMLLIAIDFDETLTRDAALWSHFISFAQTRGHRVVCVTARRPTEDNRETIDEWMQSHGIDIPVYYSALGSKVHFMEKHGHKVDIWIDDDPRKCAMGH